MRIIARKRMLFAAFLVSAMAAGSALASSHREAPLAAQEATSDLTDTYFFRSPSDPNNVVMVMGVWPFSDGMGAPNYTQFGYNVAYQFNIDNDGDSLADVTWEYTFSTVNGVEILDPAQNAFTGINTSLYNTAPITKNPANWNIVQRGSVNKVDEDRPNDPDSYSRTGLLVSPENIGPVSIGNYSALETIHTVNDEKHFFGSRDDPFWVDLGVFDLLSLRGLKTPPERYVDSVKGYNVMAIVLEVPIANVVRPGNTCTAGASTDDDCSIGFWATTYRRNVTTGARGGVTITKGAQISRLGMPLVNELVIPLRLKDAFNSLSPDQDVAALSANNALGSLFLPELAGLLGGDPNVPGPDVPGTAIGVLDGAVPAGNDNGAFGHVRCDIIRIFLTGFDGTGLGLAKNSRSDGWKLPDGLCSESNGGATTASEMIRLNVSTPVTAWASQSPLGALGGNADGFPNGRRLKDDIVDIELRAVAGVLASVFGDTSCASCGDSGSVHSALSDAIGTKNQADDKNDVDFLAEFPYLAPPHQGYNHAHHGDGFHLEIASAFIGIQSVGIALLAFFLWRRRRSPATA